MSIIVLNDLVFEPCEEGKQINKEICLFYLFLNLTSFICCSSYLYIYHKIPYYQNNSNSLTLILTRVNLVSNFSYVLFFADLFIYNPSTLTTMMKILTMINPLIIFTFYFWCTCITHNIYVTFYNYTNNLEKRIKFYKYQLIVYLFIFYIVTLFSIKFTQKEITSKDFSFMDNYGVHYIILFYLIGLFMIIYVIYRLYFIIVKKSQTFSLTSPNERTLIIRKLFQSLVARHILFLFYFLITFVPINFMMILKYIFRLVFLSNFYLSFITMTLLSLYGTFIFIIKLTEPIIRHFFLSYFLCNKKYIKEYEPLMSKSNPNPNLSNDEITDSGNEGGEKDILMHAYREYDKSFVTFYNQRQMLFAPFLQKIKYTSFNLGNNYGMLYLQGEKKELSKFAYNNLKTFSMKNIKSQKEQNKAKRLFHDSSVNIIEMLYYQEEGENNIDNNNINIEINFVNNEKSEKDNKIEKTNNNINCKPNDKNSKQILQLNQSTNSSFSDIDIKEENCPVEDLAKVNQNKKNHIENDISTKPPQTNFISLRTRSIIPSGSINFTKNISKVKLSKSINNNMRNASTLQFQQTFLDKRNTDLLNYNRHPMKFITNASRTNSQISRVELKSLTHRSPKKDKRVSNKLKHLFEEEILGYELLGDHLEKNDNIQRMMAISICINNDRKYDNQNIYQQYYISPIPWKDTNFYKEETPFIEYNEKNFPEFLNIKNDEKFKEIEFKVKEYCPFVFHHLRLLDKVSIDDVLMSLDLKNNLTIINESKVTGGRGNNSMFRSWDKKLILKTIDDDERKLLINKLLEEYHFKMKENKSLLCHIYGIFTIELADKGQSNVILQKNMNDLFINSNILTFDIKGSTANRQIIKEEHINLPQKDLINRYKGQTLKDTDLKIMGIKFELNPYHGNNILTAINNDSLFLQKYGIYDYSLLIFVNKYNKKNLEKQVGNINITAENNKKYIFNFSIIDYLGTFTLGKKGEKFMKDIVGVFKSSEGKNVSVQNPLNYGNRFRKNAKRIIIFEKEGNENDNFSS